MVANLRVRRPARSLKKSSAWARLVIGLALFASACRTESVPPINSPTLPPVASPTAIERPTATVIPTIRPTVTAVPTQPQPEPTVDPVAERVDQILAGMTLEEKVGQLFLVFFIGPDLSPALQQMINEYHVGGLVLFNISDNLRSLPQVAGLINASQNEAVNHGAKIPMFIAVDQEGGLVARLKDGATIFPGNMAIGATGAVTHAQRMAEVTAIELEALGFNMNLAPVLDVNNNPDNPVIGTRSFGSSPDLVAKLGVAMITAYRAGGIIATAKHFPGHGDTAVDSHFGLPLIPYDLTHLQSTELAPFLAAKQAGVDAIMTAHILVPALEPASDLPATLSTNILQRFLREQVGYDGLILTDSLGMGALDQLYGVTRSGEMAFVAGADVLAFGADPTHIPQEQQPVYRQILAQVKSNTIPLSRLDDSVRRILRVKARYGLLDWQPVNLDEIPQRVGTDEHRQVARQIAEDSVTLVKNDQQLLPIGSDQSVLVVWPEATGDLGGALRAYHPNLKILRTSWDPSPDEIALAVRSAASVSVTLVGTLNARQYPGQVQLVKALADRSLVVVALGVPYDLMSFPDASTYLATYGDVPVSLTALVQVVFGLNLPRGHLPVDLPGVYPLGRGLTTFDAGN